MQIRSVKYQVSHSNVTNKRDTGYLCSNQSKIVNSLTDSGVTVVEVVLFPLQPNVIPEFYTCIVPYANALSKISGISSVQMNHNKKTELSSALEWDRLYFNLASLRGGTFYQNAQINMTLR